MYPKDVSWLNVILQIITNLNRTEGLNVTLSVLFHSAFLHSFNKGCLKSRPDCIFHFFWFAVKFKDKAQILNNMARGKVEGKEKEISGKGELWYSTMSSQCPSTQCVIKVTQRFVYSFEFHWPIQQVSLSAYLHC